VEGPIITPFNRSPMLMAAYPITGQVISGSQRFNGSFPVPSWPYMRAHDLANDRRGYNCVKNFNTVKIFGGIAIYNISSDIVSE
jgi:hypothetical protein